MSRRRPKENRAESLMAAALDARHLYEDISTQVAPILSQALRENWAPEKLSAHPKIRLLLEARQITIALKEIDSAKAHAAIKDIKDRAYGKPTEKVEIRGQLERMSDDELDALLAAKLPVGDSTDEDDVH
jgi:hypothetical protein